jgi:5-methylcytosine-specific restriction endonuclease McrA
LSKEAKAKWLAKNPDYRREYYLAHREETLAAQRVKAENYSTKHLSMLARKEAIARGEKFFVGRPCLYGHDGTRYTSTKTCVECGAAHMKERNADREKANAIAMDWRAKNPEKARAAYSVSHDRRRGAGGRCSPAEAIAIRELQNDVCASCRTPLEGAGELDHIMPVKLGGSNYASNRQWLCRRCNQAKKGKDPRQYCRETGLPFLSWSPQYCL